MPALTVYASIGNSDDHLTQARWSEFHARFLAGIRAHADNVWGSWLSNPADPWQNACVSFEIQPDAADMLKEQLKRLAAEFGQDSIAWAVVNETEFLGPGYATGGPIPTGGQSFADDDGCTLFVPQPYAAGAIRGSTVTINVHGSVVEPGRLAEIVRREVLRYRSRQGD